MKRKRLPEDKKEKKTEEKKHAKPNEKEKEKEKIEGKDESEETTHITHLPPEVLTLIFQLLPLHDQFAVASVNIGFYTLVREYWRSRLLQHYCLPVEQPKQEPQDQTQTVDHLPSLYEKLKNDLKRSPDDLSGDSVRLRAGHQKRKGDTLAYYLNQNDLESLKITFPTYSYLAATFNYSLSPQKIVVTDLRYFFGNTPKRLLVHPHYQERLDYLYQLIGTEIAHSNQSFPFVFASPVLRAVLFNQSFETLLALIKQGHDPNENHPQSCSQSSDSPALISDSIDFLVIPVCLAISMDNLPQLQHLNALGASLEISVTVKNSPYLQSTSVTYNLVNLAARYKRHSIVFYLLKKLKGKIDMTETYEAAYLAGDLDALECFLECGIDIDFKALKEKHHPNTWNNFTRLAVESNRISLVKKIQELLTLVPVSLLLEPPAEKDNLLYIAAHRGHLELSLYLKDRFKNEIDFKQLENTALESREVGVLEIYLKCGLDIDFSLIKKEGPGSAAWQRFIADAVISDCVLLLEKLFSISTRGIDVTPAPNDSSAAKRRSYWLHLAAARGYIETVQLLVKYGAIVDRKDHKGKTPFQLAIKYGHAEVAHYLFEQLQEKNQTPQFNVQEKEEMITDALTNEHTEVLEFLLNYIYPEKSLESLLVGAAANGQLEIVKWLVEKKQVNSNARLPNKKPRSALATAMEWGHDITAHYLLRLQVEVRNEAWRAAYSYFKINPQRDEEDAKKKIRLLNHFTKKYADEDSAIEELAKTQNIPSSATMFYRTSARPVRPTPDPDQPTCTIS